MFLVKDWEMFYTDSHKSLEEERLVDQISIDKVNKRYILDIDAYDLVTDGYDAENNQVNSTYVSRFIFDIIVEGVKQSGFKEAIYV